MIDKSIVDGSLDLEKLGLINQGLFPVDGELAVRYHEILKKVFDLDCDVASFRVDKRGLSPELSKYFKEKYGDRFEYGENYLNMRSANQFMIVLSPDQKSAPLVAQQTSYEDELFDAVHKTARHTIEDVTATEALFGELENGISRFNKPCDLMQLRNVDVSLDTLRGTVKSALQLKALSAKLGEGNNALDENYIARMRGLVDIVGNVKDRAISDIFPIKREIHCFYVEFFKGVHCIRNFRNTKDDISSIFVYNNHDSVEDFGSEVLSVDINDSELISILGKYKFAAFNPDLIPQRLREIEDQTLLAGGKDIIAMNDFQRKAAVVAASDKFPDSYYKLVEVEKARTSKSSKVEEMVRALDYATQIKLLEPIAKRDIIEHIIAEIDPSDPVRLYRANIRKFMRDYEKMSKVQKRYTAYTILNNMKGGKA